MADVSYLLQLWNRNISHDEAYNVQWSVLYDSPGQQKKRNLPAMAFFFLQQWRETPKYRIPLISGLYTYLPPMHERKSQNCKKKVIYSYFFSMLEIAFVPLFFCNEKVENVKKKVLFLQPRPREDTYNFSQWFRSACLLWLRGGPYLLMPHYYVDFTAKGPTKVQFGQKLRQQIFSK